jgi:hypothetical protein
LPSSAVIAGVEIEESNIDDAGKGAVAYLHPYFVLSARVDIAHGRREGHDDLFAGERVMRAQRQKDEAGGAVTVRVGAGGTRTRMLRYEYPLRSGVVQPDRTAHTNLTVGIETQGEVEAGTRRPLDALLDLPGILDFAPRTGGRARVSGAVVGGLC